MTASGCFGFGREYAKLYDINLLGGIATKTVTLEPREGNLPSRICETPGGMLNSIGLANPGLKVFIKEELPFLKTLSCVKVVSVAGETEEEFIKIISKLSPLDGYDVLELNVSCPNVERGGMAFGTDPGIVSSLVSVLRKETKKPLWVKLTPNVTDIVSIGKASVDSGADALVAINTLVGMGIDIVTCTPRLGNVLGGFSGPAIKPVALAKVFALHRALPDVPIIGVGGISEPSDAIEFLLAGASAVQIGSGIFPNPGLPLVVIEGLQAYCLENNFANASDLTGYLILPGK